MRPLEKRDLLILNCIGEWIPTQWALPDIYIPTVGFQKGLLLGPTEGKSPTSRRHCRGRGFLLSGSFGGRDSSRGTEVMT